MTDFLPFELEFVVADESTDHEGLTDVRLYRWDDLDQWSDSEQSPAFLENLAQDIKIRYRTRHGSNESPSTDDHRIAHLPRDCDSIWRVKVQVRVIKGSPGGSDFMVYTDWA
jgi:hypothetical protein